MAQVIKEKIEVGKTVTGQTMTFDKFTIDSGVAGKTIYIQGGIHGGEVTLPVIRRLYSWLRENLNCGKVIFVPYCNPAAWGQVVYGYTVGKFSLATGADFNRAFGKKVQSLSDQNINLLGQIIRSCDLLIDLHTARVCVPHCIVFDEKMLEFARKTNILLTRVLKENSSFAGASGEYARQNGVPALVIECGSHDTVDPHNIEIVSDAVLALVCDLGMAKFKATQKQVFYFRSHQTITTPCAGIAVFKKQPGDSFKKGEVLFEILPADLTQEKYQREAAFDGLVFMAKRTHIFNEFDVVIDVIKTDELVKF
jgi:predicted deacylase